MYLIAGGFALCTRKKYEIFYDTFIKQAGTSWNWLDKLNVSYLYGLSQKRWIYLLLDRFGVT